MIKAHTEWSFTDQPDVFRMCRELAEAGCSVGLSTRADGAITLVDTHSNKFQCTQGRALELQDVLNARPERFHVFGGWFCLRGDLVKEVLKVSPVTVKGYR